MINMSPLLQARLELQGYNNQNNVQPNVNILPKPDIAEFSYKTSEKDTGRYLLTGLALAAAVTASAISLIKKGKLLGAEKAQKYALKVQNKAEKLKAEVTQLFNNGGIKDGNIVADIIDNNGTQIMKEFSQNGLLIRKSTFTDKILSSVETAATKGLDEYKFDENGLLSGFCKSRVVLKNGDVKIAKILNFQDGILTGYAKKNELPKDGGIKAEKVLGFKDGKLLGYKKGTDILDDGSGKIAKSLAFRDGKLIWYAKGSKILEDKSMIVKTFIYNTNGKWKIEHDFPL